MPDFQETITARNVIICDACGRREQTAVYDAKRQNRFTIARQHEDALRAQGWRLFVGRSRRWYCPNDGPKPGHRMYEVTR